MPDFLGEDQRKTKPDDGGEEKIRCQFICKLLDKEEESRRERGEREFSCVTGLLHLSVNVALDEGDIEILKSYVSLPTHTCMYNVYVYMCAVK